MNEEIVDPVYVNGEVYESAIVPSGRSTPSNHFVHLVVQGVVYASRTFDGEEDIWNKICIRLGHLPSDQTATEIFRWNPHSWRFQEDIKQPFGDGYPSWRVACVWIFDIDHDLLTLLRSDGSQYRTSLEKIRSGEVVKLKDLDAFKPTSFLYYDPSMTYYAYNKPNDGWDQLFRATERQIAFCGRLMADFTRQWRHVLRGSYSDSTFLKLGAAIVRIWNLDFKVHETNFSKIRRVGRVELESLPQWPALPGSGRIIHLDRCSVILCQQLSLHAIIAHIRADIERRGPDLTRLPRLPRGICHSILYVVISVREIMLVRTCNIPFHNHTQYTDAAKLLDPRDEEMQPSERALDFLSALVPFEDYSDGMRFHMLPNELQDMIIRETSDDPIDSARVGCMLGMGGLFRWRRDGINLEQRGSWSSHDNWTNKWTKVKPYKLRKESQILFGGADSGIAYPHTEVLEPQNIDEWIEMQNTNGTV